MLRPPPTSPLFPYTTLFRSQRTDGICRKQTEAAFGDHHGVDNEALHVPLAQFSSDEPDNCSRREHAGLHSIDPDIIEQSIELRLDNIERQVERSEVRRGGKEVGEWRVSLNNT